MIARNVTGSSPSKSMTPTPHDPAPSSVSPVLMYDAIERNDLEMVAHGLDSGFDVLHRDVKGLSLVRRLLVTGDHADMLRLLMNRGADIHEIGEAKSLLAEAVVHDNVECVVVLLDAGIDPNHGHGLVLTMLHLALARNHPERSDMVQHLLGAGTSLDYFQQITGRSLLDYCIEKCDSRTLKVLLSHGIHPSHTELPRLEKSLQMAKDLERKGWIFVCGNIKAHCSWRTIIETLQPVIDSKRAMLAIESLQIPILPGAAP